VLVYTLILQMQKTCSAGMACHKAVIRSAAPAFKAAAWYQDKIQTVSLEQFKGKS